jgi:phage-related tail fiber protein
VSTIRFSDAVTALLAALAASAPLAGVTIADGPSPTAAADSDFIIVGHDGSLDPDGALSGITQAGTFTQAWLEFKAIKDEAGHIHCVAVSQTGDSTDLPARRARAEALVAACEDAALGAGVVSGLQFEGTEDGSVIYRQLLQGVAAMIPFTIGYTTQW